MTANKLKKKAFSPQSGACSGMPNANHVVFDVVFNLFPKELDAQETWDKMGTEALQIGNFTILGQRFHKFDPSGASGFWLLSESHMAFHTWPEEKYISMDLFTCGSWKRAEETLAKLEEQFAKLGGTIVNHRRMRRGFIFNSENG